MTNQLDTINMGYKKMKKILLAASVLCTCFAFAKKSDPDNGYVPGSSRLIRAGNGSEQTSPRFRPYQLPSGRGRRVAAPQTPLSQHR